VQSTVIPLLPNSGEKERFSTECESTTWVVRTAIFTMTVKPVELDETVKCHTSEDGALTTGD